MCRRKVGSGRRVAGAIRSLVSFPGAFPSEITPLRAGIILDIRSIQEKGKYERLMFGQLRDVEFRG